MDQELELFGAVAVTEAGAVAWIASNIASEAGTETFEVWKHDSAGAQRLDAGPAIRPRSLKAATDAVSWTNGATPRRATLAP